MWIKCVDKIIMDTYGQERVIDEVKPLIFMVKAK